MCHMLRIFAFGTITNGEDDEAQSQLDSECLDDALSERHELWQVFSETRLWPCEGA